jgi:hypothetical protein
MLFVIVTFCFISCHSNPENIDGLIDYSDISLSKTKMYNINLDIYNKDIVSLKKGVVNEIVKSDGIINNDVIENRNRNRIMIYIPKQNIANFIENIKSYGIIVNEAVDYVDINREMGINDIEMRIENAENMLEKFDKLLIDADNIADKIALEKEINTVRNEIEMLKLRTEEMETRVENVTMTILMYK